MVELHCAGDVVASCTTIYVVLAGLESDKGTSFCLCGIYYLAVYFYDVPLTVEVSGLSYGLGGGAAADGER